MARAHDTEWQPFVAGVSEPDQLVDEPVAHRFAQEAGAVAGLPEGSEQHSILVYEPHTIPGTLSRLRSFIGNIGTIPSMDMPDSHNAGDFGSFLVGASHRFAMTTEELAEHRTDGHLDCDSVRAGAVLAVPVKVDGGGIYLGDAHADEGDGELSLHTTDITADVEVRVDVLKGVHLEGPVLLPVPEDLPWIARPFAPEEIERGRRLGERHGVQVHPDVAPVQFIGTGTTINAAADNAIARTATLLGINQAEVRNRCTISGGVEIARLPGVVQLTMLTPLHLLDRVGLGDLARRHYGLWPRGGGCATPRGSWWWGTKWRRTRSEQARARAMAIARWADRPPRRNDARGASGPWATMTGVDTELARQSSVAAQPLGLARQAARLARARDKL